MVLWQGEKSLGEGKTLGGRSLFVYNCHDRHLSHTSVVFVRVFLVLLCFVF